MSRPDNLGMFWYDLPQTRVKAAPRDRIMPAIPETGWRPPSAFPRLEAARMISIDLETEDQGISAGQGPGWPWRGGEITGIAIGTDDGSAWYFPMRHKVGGGNLNPEAVLSWAKDELSRDHQPKVGANLLYDLGWLKAEGVEVRGKLKDVQFAEPLLDEHRISYSLAVLAESYGLTEEGKGQAEKELYEWSSLAYGGKPTRRDQGKNIHQCPAVLVGPYAIQDALLPFQILNKQLPHLEGQSLSDLFLLECSLIPLLLEMRWRGFRVDVEKAERVAEEMRKEEVRLLGLLGPGANVNDKEWLIRAFDRVGIAYPKTIKGNPSFTASFLESVPGDLPETIRAVRRLEKARGTFLEGYILNNHHNGRLYGEFHPLRSDTDGTISGRFSSSNPNLQNIPSRDRELRELIRGCFLAEEGEQINAFDYSQVEYRLMVHKAIGPGAEEARERYRRDPSTDYHGFVQDLVREKFGRELPRKPIKNVNFGKIFGMGEAKLMRMLGFSQEEADEFFRIYDEAIPFAKITAKAASDAADRKGYITTIAGRRARFPFWESKNWKEARRDGWMPLDQAREKYGPGGFRRARLNKALNAYTQGSGGDIIKLAMLDVWESLGELPLATVHDELVFSLPPGEAGERRARMIKEYMGYACRLSVPLLVSREAGPSWGEIKPC